MCCMVFTGLSKITKTSMHVSSRTFNKTWNIKNDCVVSVFFVETLVHFIAMKSNNLLYKKINKKMKINKTVPLTLLRAACKGLKDY